MLENILKLNFRTQDAARFGEYVTAFWCQILIKGWLNGSVGIDRRSIVEVITHLMYILVSTYHKYNEM